MGCWEISLRSSLEQPRHSHTKGAVWAEKDKKTLSPLSNGATSTHNIHQPMSKKAAKLARKDKSTADGGEERNDEERRRLKHLKRQAQRVVDHFAELGLDEFGQPLDNFSLLKYPVREWKFTLLGCEEAIAINPVVMLIAAVCLWGFVLLSTRTFCSKQCGNRTHRRRISHVCAPLSNRM